MAELTIEQKRLAIEKGLSQFLPESVLQRALSYWEREYGHQPSFVLNRFLSEVCSNDELRMQRKEMLRQVLYEISILEKQQHLKVKDKKVSTTQPSIQINENNNALFQVFHDFVMAVLKGVVRDDYLEFVEEIQKSMKKHRLLAGYFYLLGAEQESLKQISQQHYADMLTMLYAIYCDFYGPNKADQLYAAIRQEIKQNYTEVNLASLL